MKTIHPAVAEHVMEENERLRGLLQEALHAHRNPNRALFPYDRIDAALSPQAEPECVACEGHPAACNNPCALCGKQVEPTETFTAVDMATAAAQGFIDGQAAVEPAAVQDDREIAELIDQRDNAEDWANKLSAAIASHTGAYIGEHSNMNYPWANALEAIENTRPAQTEQQPVGHQFQDREGVWKQFMSERHYEDTLADGTWPIRAIYAAPIAQTEQQPEPVLLERIDAAIKAFTSGKASMHVPPEPTDVDMVLGECWQLVKRLSSAPQPEQSGLVEALEQYADDSNWCFDTCKIDRDIAKDALAAYHAALSAQGASK